MNVASEIQARVFAVANDLFEQADRANFPTVDAVRKGARVNMNDASTVMREWRRAQMAHPGPQAAQVPAVLQQAQAEALATLWTQAQQLAGQSLAIAQAAWDGERAEALVLHQQMAEAFDEQGRALDASRSEVLRVAALHEQAEAACNRLQVDLLGSQEQLALVNADLSIMRIRAQDLERLANTLRTELDHAHQALAQAQAASQQSRAAHVTEMHSLRAELIAQAEQFALERDSHRKLSLEALERYSSLSGQVESLKEQNANLIRVLHQSGSPDDLTDQK